MDLNPKVIDSLGLEEDTNEIKAKFETAGGIAVEAPMYRVLVRLLGREACVLASPSELPEDKEEDSGDEEEEDSGDDEEDTSESEDEVEEDALLGHDALAELGLLVDCRHKRLLLDPARKGKDKVKGRRR